MKRAAILGMLFVVLAGSAYPAASVVINEFAYDDLSTDTLEFVELYNTTGSPVDISGWHVAGIDLATATADVDITIPANTILAPGAYYVLGQNVLLAAITLTPASAEQNIEAAADFQNDMESVSLLSGAWTNPPTNIVDSLVYERNKANIIIPAGLGEPAFDGVSATSGGGYWGNSQTAESGENSANSIDLDGDPNWSFSLSRYPNGTDTNVNAADFVCIPATPGASNNYASTVALPATLNFDAADGTLSADFLSPWATMKVQDPAVADANPSTPPATTNPSVIASSPQGGNIGVNWDDSGGGNVQMLRLAAQSNMAIDAYVYYDTGADVAGDQEQWGILMRGWAEALFNWPAVGTSANGDRGVRLRFDNVSTGPVNNFILEESNGFGVTTNLATLTAPATGWQRTLLQVNGSSVLLRVGGTVGTVSGTLTTATTTQTGSGTLWLQYREAVATNANVDPLRIDGALIETTSAVPAELSLFSAN